MAVVRRRISPEAMRMEVGRLTTASREHVMVVNGRSIMVASPITFEILPVSQFASFDEMIAAFDTTSFGGI